MCGVDRPLHSLHRASEEEARLGVAAGNRTRDLLHCRRTLYAKSHSNGVIDCYSEPRLVLLQGDGSGNMGVITLFDTKQELQHDSGYTIVVTM